MSFGLVITTYNEHVKPGKLERALEIANDPRIDEVVITDDSGYGSYVEEIGKRLALLRNHWPDAMKKVRLRQNKGNLGVFGNKLKGIEHSTCDWVQSLDSDNQISTAYLDCLFGLMKYDDEMLCPSFAKPEFDYRERETSTITLGNFHEFVNWKPIGCMMNTGNQCFHRRKMLEVMQDVPAESHDLKTREYFPDDFDMSGMEHRKIYDSADSLFFNKKWLIAGGALLIGKGLEYEHEVHAHSSWKAAPALKEALPPIYFKEILDHAKGFDDLYTFLGFKHAASGRAVELQVNKSDDWRIWVDIQTGQEVKQKEKKAAR